MVEGAPHLLEGGTGGGPQKGLDYVPHPPSPLATFSPTAKLAFQLGESVGLFSLYHLYICRSLDGTLKDIVVTTGGILQWFCGMGFTYSLKVKNAFQFVLELDQELTEGLSIKGGQTYFSA